MRVLTVSPHGVEFPPREDDEPDEYVFGKITQQSSTDGQLVLQLT